MADIHYMTQDGLEKLKKDLADALAKRPEISAAIAEAREKGDLSENAEYDAAREAQGLLEIKIANLWGSFRLLRDDGLDSTAGCDKHL